MKKKELDNLILNEIFGFSKNPSDWESKDFERFEKRILQKFPNVQTKELPLGKILRRLRVGYAGWEDFPRNRWEEIFTDSEISRLSSEIKEKNFKKILDQYTDSFTGKDAADRAGIVKPKKIGAGEEDDLPAKKDTKGDDPDLPRRAKKKGELSQCPVS